MVDESSSIRGKLYYAKQESRVRSFDTTAIGPNLKKQVIDS